MLDSSLMLLLLLSRASVLRRAHLVQSEVRRARQKLSKSPRPLMQQADKVSSNVLRLCGVRSAVLMPPTAGLMAVVDCLRCSSIMARHTCAAPAHCRR